MAISIPQIHTPVRSSLPQKASVRYSMIEVVLLIVVIGLFYWFIAKPKIAELSVQQAKLESVQSEQQALAGNLKKLKGLVAQLKSSPDKVKLLDEAMPLHGKTTDVETLIDYLAKSSGVSIADISATTKNDLVAAGNKEVLKDPYAVKRTLQKITAEANVMGTYDQLVSFMKKLEQNGRVLNANAMELRTGDEGQLNLRLTIETYFYE